MQNNMLRTACRQYAPYRMQNNALRASQGFFIFFVENVDYAEIQVELDGAVEERTRQLGQLEQAR